MNTEQLYYFELAYTEGSFSAAARKVPVSHQGLTKSIRSLERELGVTLFAPDPDTGLPAPTPYAQELYEFVTVFHSNLRPVSYTHLDVYKRQSQGTMPMSVEAVSEELPYLQK